MNKFSIQRGETMKLAIALLAILAILAALVIVPKVDGQATAPLQTTAVASALCYEGTCYVSTQATEELPAIYLGANKNTVISLGARQDLVPNLLDGYLGLVNYQPDLTGILSHTPFNPDQFKVSFDFGGGAATFASGIPAQPMLEGQINVGYDLSPSNGLTTCAIEGGFIRLQRFYGFCAGWAHTFNAINPNGDSNSPSLRMRHLVARAKAGWAARHLKQ
jgi:hypothetical protein